MDSSSYSIAIIKPDAHRDMMAEMIGRDLEEGGLDVIFRKDIVFSEVQAKIIYLPIVFCCKNSYF